MPLQYVVYLYCIVCFAGKQVSSTWKVMLKIFQHEGIPGLFAGKFSILFVSFTFC